MKPQKRMVVFASGNGTNAENIINYFQQKPERGEVVAVVCNREGAGVIARAERLNVPVKVMSRAEINNPATMNPFLDEIGADSMILAGFLLMVPDFLLDRFGDRILNIHPSLLPKYGGKGMFGHHVHEAVVAAGETESGITIHRVSRICDGGEIVFQAKVAVLPTDTPSDVEAKVHELEKRHFAEVIDLEL